jgi:membrane-associated PAP2 superfamily phosphatase
MYGRDAAGSPFELRSSLWRPGEDRASGTVKDLMVLVVLPALLLTAITFIIRTYDLDRAICRAFYLVSQNHFPGSRAGVCLFLYRYAPVPGLILGVGGATLAVLSLFIRRLGPLREPCAFLALLLAFGPGLLVNGILKASWDRPRPCELVEFGGHEEFVSVLSIERRGTHCSKSFPSGHASMGFYLLAPGFLLYKQKRHWSITFFLIGLAYGLLVGLARVAQGSHFPSDVVWAGAMVYFPGVMVWYVFQLLRPLTLPRDGARQAATADRMTISLEERHRVPAHSAAGTEGDEESEPLAA